jgi:hypothetical protein
VPSAARPSEVVGRKATRLPAVGEPLGAGEEESLGEGADELQPVSAATTTRAAPAIRNDGFA